MSAEASTSVARPWIGRQAPARAGAMSTIYIIAARAGLVSCSTCRLLSRLLEPTTPRHCPRCGARLASPCPGSVQRTWALLVAAAISSVPADMLLVAGNVVLIGKLLALAYLLINLRRGSAKTTRERARLYGWWGTAH